MNLLNFVYQKVWQDGWRAGIQFQRTEDEIFHADCICQKAEAEFYENGQLQYLFVDGVKFVPEVPYE